MSISSAKGRLDWQAGDPATGFVTAARIKAAFDDLSLAWNRLVVWPGTGGVGSWPARPTGLPAGTTVEWQSTLDPDAPPPPAAVAGDTWKRAPGANY